MTIVSTRDREPMRAFRAYVPPAALAVLRLDAKACHWPLGDVEGDDFRFCLAERSEGSYCAAHARLARRGR